MDPLRTGGPEPEDNRRHPRVHARGRCWCEGENVTFYARVGNLSEGGLFLRTSTPLPVGSATKLRFDSGALQIRPEARVIWSRGEGEVGPPGMGLQFGAVEPEGLSELQQLIGSELATRRTAG